MNTKQIIALAAILAVAAAAIAGTAYAYQATLTNTANDIASDYLALDAAAFEGAFDNTNIDYDSETTSANSAHYVPVGAEDIPGIVISTVVQKGVVVNATAYTLKVNSTSMNTADKYLLKLTTLWDDPSTVETTKVAKDLQGLYWVKVNNGTTDTFTQLTGTSAIKIYESDVRSQHDLSITVYAVEFDGTASTLAKVPGISGVDFKFVAESATKA